MKKSLAMIVMLAAALGAAGCTKDKPSQSNQLPAQAVIASRELVTCMRTNGVPDFPDLQIENGKLTEPQLDAAQTAAAETAAAGPCLAAKQRVDEALGEVGQTVKRPLDAAELEKVRQFAGCLRQHGLPQWPDSDATGTFHITGTGLEPLFADKSQGMPPQVDEAITACTSVHPASWGIAN